jgi:hypothetical protein
MEDPETMNYSWFMACLVIGRWLWKFLIIGITLSCFGLNEHSLIFFGLICVLEIDICRAQVTYFNAQKLVYMILFSHPTSPDNDKETFIQDFQAIALPQFAFGSQIRNANTSVS